MLRTTSTTALTMWTGEGAVDVAPDNLNPPQLIELRGDEAYAAAIQRDRADAA